MIAEAVKTSKIPKAEWRFKISWNIEPECTIWRFQFPVNVLSDGCFVATNKTGIMLKPHFKVFLWNIKKVETRTTFFFTNKTSICFALYVYQKQHHDTFILGNDIIWNLFIFSFSHSCASEQLVWECEIVELKLPKENPPQCWDNKQPTWLPYFKHSKFNSKLKIQFKILRSVDITNDLPGSPISNIQNSIQNSIQS